jgi:hypothetical protein
MPNNEGNNPDFSYTNSGTTFDFSPDDLLQYADEEPTSEKRAT